MRIAVVATEAQQQEWMAQVISDTVSIVWLRESVAVEEVDAYLNLRAEEEWLHQPLPDFLPSLVIVNAVVSEGKDWPAHFIRINGWPGFLKGAVLEASGGNEAQQQAATQLLQRCGRQAEWVSDQFGFIGARVVSAIINEAYLTLQEKVSSKEDIDTAMKLGTNYPMGPFTWAAAIGIKNVYALLHTLAAEQPRYTPAMLLKQEAEQ
ncbi:MAG: 3-hydroxyacyl-CoA dehydrogenase family protein [Sphingomonadales bacterium]